MFLSRVQIGSYRVGPGLFGPVLFGSGSIRIGSFSVSVLSGKKKLNPKNTCKFFVQFWIGYFWIGSGSGLRVQVKMPRPSYGPESPYNL